MFAKSRMGEHKLLGTKLLGKLSISLHLYNQKLWATTKVIVHKYNDARSEVAAKRVNLTDHVRARFYLRRFFIARRCKDTSAARGALFYL